MSDANAGVAAIVRALGAIETGSPSRSVAPPGHYAAVLEIAPNLGIASGTDSAGSKVIVAGQTGRFDTVGIDCARSRRHRRARRPPRHLGPRTRGVVVLLGGGRLIFLGVVGGGRRGAACRQRGLDLLSGCLRRWRRVGRRLVLLALGLRRRAVRRIVLAHRRGRQLVALRVLERVARLLGPLLVAFALAGKFVCLRLAPVGQLVVFAHGNRRTRPAAIGSVDRIRRLGILLALLIAAPAEAAVVARDGDQALRAKRQGGRICLSLKAPEGTISQGCEPSPVSPFQPVFLASFGGNSPLAGAVPARVRAVEVGGRRVDTVAAAGFRDRFFIVEGSDPAALLRLFDAGGELIAAARNDDARFDVQASEQVVLRRAGVRITAARDFELRPDPLRLDRTVPNTCFSIRIGNGSTGTCLADGASPALSVGVERRCAPARAVISGTVTPAVRRVELLLGSGRRVRVPTYSLPASFGEPFRLVAAQLPRGEAVRSARGLDAQGETRGRSVVRSAPGGLPCEDDSLSDFSVSTLAFGGGIPAKGAGAAVKTVAGHRLYAGDGKARNALCVAFDRPRSGCTLAPVDSAFFTLERAGNAVGGLLAGDVSSVTLHLDRGAPLGVRTTAGPAYEGRFAGRVRFLAARVPAGRLVERAIARDADGRRLGRGFVFGSFTNEVVARIPPNLAVHRFSGGVEGFERDAYCVRPGNARGFAAFATCRSRREATTVAVASCAPRRLLLFGYLPRGVQAVDVELGSGKRAPARIVHLGPEAGGGRVWVYVPDRAAGLRAVVYSDRPPRPFPRFERPSRRQPLRLPPVDEQCGYDESTDIF